MSLPQSVQAQVAAAAKHFDRVPENPEAAASTAEKAPDDEQNPQSDTEQPGTESPEAQPAEKPKVEPKPESQDALYWQHRFQVLQGKYNGELPALRKENEQLKLQIADRDLRIQEQEQKAPASENSGITDEQLAHFKHEYGEDLITFIERMSQPKAATPVDTGNTQELQERIDRLESDKQEDAQARFWVNLEQAVPSFRQVNTDPAFLQFLSQFDPQTGKQYQQALNQAQQSLDAKGVADVFKLYLNQAAPKRQEKRTVPDEQVEPRTTKAAPTPQAQGGKLWTGADITQFYRDKTAGRYSADEAQRLEADIFAAQREGRVR